MTSSRPNLCATSLPATRCPLWMGSNVPPITPIRRRALAKIVSLVTLDNNMISCRAYDAVAIYPEWRYDGAMTTVPDRARVRLTGISSRAYEHPADRSALVALRKLSGFDVLLAKLFGLINERALRLTYLAGAVRVSERQFPHIHALVRDGSYILDLPDVPECYVIQSPIVNAMAIGRDRPFVVITTGLVNLHDEEELRWVIGHEVGHILSGHAVYRTMILILISLAARVAWMPLGYIGLRAIIWALEEWFRKSELSCDRAGLLAGQDVDAARRA